MRSDCCNPKWLSYCAARSATAILTSCIYTPERCLISDFVAASAQGDKTEFKQSRHIALQLATEVKRSLSINNSREALLFGADAMAQHMADPTEGVFIKSPKSFWEPAGCAATW